MKLCINEVLYAFSVALDAVEHELAGVTTYHSQRVAYMTSTMGKFMGMDDNERMLLAAASLLHDNALSEYVQGELASGVPMQDIRLESRLERHCAYGEANVRVLPFYEGIKHAILYHHETADGTGPMGKMPAETPLYARLIHLADRVDVQLDFSAMSPEKYETVRKHVMEETGRAYDSEVAEVFLQAIHYEALAGIAGDNIVTILFDSLPRVHRQFTTSELTEFANMFARIIDYKSPFTTRHSVGIAEKARAMGAFYGWDAATQNKLYFAGAMHDIGKLLIPNGILEKPGKLTTLEYRDMQNHAAGTYAILRNISGIDDITRWASRHHEKLDGSGYPFGLSGEELDHKDRLLACIDVYQALVEPRPYKDGLPHAKVMEMLRDMVDKGKLDGDIVADIDTCFGAAHAA